MIDFFRESRLKQNIVYISLLFFICLLSAWVNRLPEDYIIAQGDHIASINIKEVFSRQLYLWNNITNGAGTIADPSYLLHYCLYFFLDLLGFSDSQKMSIKFFIFIFSSAFFTYLAIGIFFKSKVSPATQFIIALFYTFNTIALLLSVSTGSYLGYMDFYCFFPLVWVLFARGLIDRNKQYLLLSVLFFFLSSPGFKNIAYAVLILIFLGLTVLFLWGTRLIDLKRVLLAGVVFSGYIASISFILAGNVILFLDIVRGNLPDLAISNTSTVKQWIIGSSQPPLYLFNFFSGWNGFPKDYFGPISNILYKVLTFYPSFILGLSLILSTFFIKNRTEKLWLFFFSIMFLLVIFGSAKAKLSESLSLFIFSLPLLNIFKSWDKFFVFQPFFIAMLFYFLLEYFNQTFKNKNLKVLVYSGLILIIIFCSTPFFIGKLHRNFSMSHLWGYEYSVIVKTPDYYKEIAQKVNSEHGFFKILYMPYSKTIGEGWTGYPKWKFIGKDHTVLFFNNPVYSPIVSGFNFYFAKQMHTDPQKAEGGFVEMARINGIRYLIVNKDVIREHLMTFKYFDREIEENFIFIKSFGNLDLYRLSSDEELPVMYSPDNNVIF